MFDDKPTISGKTIKLMALGISYIIFHSKKIIYEILVPYSYFFSEFQFVLDFKWEVVAGDESKEVEIQNQREMRVLEAVYPRPSAIPPKCDASLTPQPFLF